LEWRFWWIAARLCGGTGAPSCGLWVRPELQGHGAGRLLLEGLHRTARSLGLEQLQLTVRGGTGVERFYERFGYAVVGSHPGAVRLAPGDEIMMIAWL